MVSFNFILHKEVLLIQNNVIPITININNLQIIIEHITEK